MAKEDDLYEFPFKDETTSLIPDPFFDPEAFLTKFWFHHLDGGLQAGDVDLFLSEPWLSGPTLSVGFFTMRFRKDHPDEEATALDYQRRRGINKISDLIRYFEGEYGQGVADQRDRWLFILTKVPSIHALWKMVIKHETPEASADRMLKIKRKLLRMPTLDASCGQPGIIKAEDDIPAALHPKDSALLAVLGMLIGLAIVRSADEELVA